MSPFACQTEGEAYSTVPAVSYSDVNKGSEGRQLHTWYSMIMSPREAEGSCAACCARSPPGWLVWRSMRCSLRRPPRMRWKIARSVRFVPADTQRSSEPRGLVPTPAVSRRARRRVPRLPPLFETTAAGINCASPLCLVRPGPAAARHGRRCVPRRDGGVTRVDSAV